MLLNFNVEHEPTWLGIALTAVKKLVGATLVYVYFVTLRHYPNLAWERI